MTVHVPVWFRLAVPGRGVATMVGLVGSPSAWLIAVPRTNAQ